MVVIGGVLCFDNYVVWKCVVDEVGGKGVCFVVFGIVLINLELSVDEIVNVLNV